MPIRTHELKIGIGISKQTGTGLPGTTAAQLQTALGAGALRSFGISAFNTPVPQFNKEDNAEFYGKGHEFVTQVFPTSIDAPWEWPTPFLSSQAWAMATVFALGKTTESNPGTGAYQYVTTVMDPATDGVNLPATTIVAGLRQGTAGEALDQALVGCVCTGFTLNVRSGPGLQNSQLTSRWLGCGKFVQNSGLTIPSAYPEHRLGAGGTTVLTINGVDYVANSQFVNFEFTYETGLIPDAGYFVGSGSQNDYDIRGRMRYGIRKLTFVWEAELESTSTQLSDLLNGVQGQTTITMEGATITGAIKHTATIFFPWIQHRAVSYGDVNGFTTVRVTTDVQYGTTLAGPVSLTAITDITGIGQ